MSYGSDSPGGAPDGIGGNESEVDSGLGEFGDSLDSIGSFDTDNFGLSDFGISGLDFSGNVDSGVGLEGVTSLQEAMMQSDAQAMANNMERGLAALDNSTVDSISETMTDFNALPEQARDRVADQLAAVNLRSDIAGRSMSEIMSAIAAANAVGMSTKDIWGGLTQKAAKSLIGFAGNSIFGGLGDLAANYGAAKGLHDQVQEGVKAGNITSLPDDYYGGQIPGGGGVSLMNLLSMGAPQPGESDIEMNEIDSLLGQLTRPSSNV